MATYKSFLYYLLFAVVGGILFSAIGALITTVFPSASIIKVNLTDFIGINLEIIRVEFKLSLSSIIGIVSGLFICHKI